MRRIRAAFPSDARQPRHYLLGLDFDGTLAPLAPKPGLAQLPAGNKRLLRKLVKLRRVRVAIVSGRGLADLKRKVPVAGLIFVGNHGLEIEDRRGRVWVHAQARRNVKLMHRLAAKLGRELKGFPGVLIENKGLTLSVHYRRLPRYLSPVPIHDRIAAMIASLSHRVRLKSGKKVWEIRPALKWDKGYAMRRLLGTHVGKDWIPVLVGDDATDEEGFRSLGPDAITIRVGYKKDSHARYRLKNQRQTALLLEYLAREWRDRAYEGISASVNGTRASSSIKRAPQK
jgi:trehalose 6-phosphate phosphatase